ncbi:MAG: DUF4861 family protein [Rikenellaceae bacterium]
MNRLFTLLLLTTPLVCSCVSQRDAMMMVTLENASATDRSLETIEIPWKAITDRLEGVTPSSVLVVDGDQIPSQVLFVDGDSLRPHALIFQRSLASGATDTLYITMGVQQHYPQMAYSRFVPERKDDYAWENNLVAQRVYGKALEDELRTSGVDVWSKKVPDMIIDKWYKINNYHVDSGEGMDNYKVGNTLGGGSSAPLVDGKMVLGGNMVEWKRTANGPLRTEFTLSYAPYMVDGVEVLVSKNYSLDANSHFTKVTDTYSGSFEQLPLAVGFMIHSLDAPYYNQKGMMALYEPVSDGNPEVGGEIGVAVYVPQSDSLATRISDHSLQRVSANSGIPFSYYIGSAWSQANMQDAQSWFDHCQRFVSTLHEPLIVKLY